MAARVVLYLIARLKTGFVFILPKQCYLDGVGMKHIGQGYMSIITRLHS